MISRSIVIEDGESHLQGDHNLSRCVQGQGLENPLSQTLLTYTSKYILHPCILRSYNSRYMQYIYLHYMEQLFLMNENNCDHSVSCKESYCLEIFLNQLKLQTFFFYNRQIYYSFVRMVHLIHLVELHEYSQMI